MSGCAGVESEPAPVDQGSARPGTQALGQFLMHVQPGAKKITMHRLSSAALDLEKAHGPGLAPQAMIDANLQQDSVSGSNGGSTTNSSVELVTGWVGDSFGAGAIATGCATGASPCCPAGSFCADVALNSFWTVPLNFTYAVVSSIFDSSGTTLSKYNAVNSDNANHTGLSSSFGLWMYQTAGNTLASHGSFPSSTSGYGQGAQGVMLPGVANGATRTWQFANPDDGDFYVRLGVQAATAYSNYNITALTYKSNPAFMDGCVPGTGESGLAVKLASDDSTVATAPAVANSAKQVYVALPFDFTFYGTKYPASGGRINFSKYGNLTLSNGVAANGELPKLADNPLAPAAANAPHAGMWAWWDDSAIGSGGGLCAKLVGSAPTRQAVVSWKKVARTGNGSLGPYVNYSVTLNESTEEIWFNYGTIQTGNGAAPWSAGIGAIDPTGTTLANNWVSTTATFPNGAPGRLVLQPIP
jgi:hypothetical protein